MLIAAQSVYIHPAPYLMCTLLLQIARTPANMAFHVWCGRN